MNISGTAFHIGVGSEEISIYEKAIKDCAEIFEYGKALGFKMGKYCTPLCLKLFSFSPALDLLDIGGGFHGHDDDSVVRIKLSLINISTKITLSTCYRRERAREREGVQG